MPQGTLGLSQTPKKTLQLEIISWYTRKENMPIASQTWNIFISTSFLTSDPQKKKKQLSLTVRIQELKEMQQLGFIQTHQGQLVANRLSEVFGG